MFSRLPYQNTIVFTSFSEPAYTLNIFNFLLFLRLTILSDKLTILALPYSCFEPLLPTPPCYPHDLIHSIFFTRPPSPCLKLYPTNI